MDVDTAVARIYEAADHSPGFPPGIGPLAIKLFGRGCVRLAPGPSSLLFLRDAWSLRVDERLAREELTLEIARLIGYWAGNAGLVPAFMARSPKLAPALVLPTPAARLLVALSFSSDDMGHVVGLRPHVVRARLRAIGDVPESGEFASTRTG